MTLHEKVILLTHTSILICDSFEVHKYTERLLSRSAWIHGLASEVLWETIKEKAKSDSPRIIEP